MRILLVSNYYPPSRYSWGFQQLCEETANGLAARGHTVAVLTSTDSDREREVHPYPVHRLLHIDPNWHSGRSAAWQFFVGRRQRERQDVASLRRVVDAFEPDIIFFWHTLGLSRVMIQKAEQMPDLVVASYLADYTPEHSDEYLDYWRVEPSHWSAKLFKRPLAKAAVAMLAREGKPVPLEYENVFCVSDYLRHRLVSQGLVSDKAVVVYNGIDLKSFPPANDRIPKFLADGLHCLVAGRIVPVKGVHTAIEALAHLDPKTELAQTSLTILGDGPQDYIEHLQGLIAEHHLQNAVAFRATVPRRQMPQVLAQHNVLLLPSEYAEPLARAIQEAMATGLLVIGTTTGGSGELLVHEKTGLVFEAGNPRSLAEQLARATSEPELAARLAQAGQQTVVERFTIQRTVEQIESHLLELIDEAA